MNVQGVTPTMMAPQQAQSVSSPRAATNGTTGSSNGAVGLLGGSSTNLQQTFLSLLVTELQNQDPTSPVDPTQMVGQMVSLNQLDQLISMNQTLTNIANGTSTVSSSSVSSGSAGSNAAAQLASQASTGSTAAPRLAGSSTGTQPLFAPIDPNAMMNLYGSLPAANTSSTN